MKRTRGLVLPFMAVLCVLMSGCGSRADFTLVQGRGVGDSGDVGSAPVSGESTTGSAGTTGVSAPSASGGTGITESTTGTGVGGIGGATGTSGRGGSSGPGGTSGASGTTTGLPGGQVNKAPIRLSYIVQGTAGVSALTGSNVSGNSDVAVQTMNGLVAYANSHGGVGGRKISATPSKSEATSQQSERLALCKHITEDLKAQVLLDSNQYGTEDGWRCFAQHKTAYFGTVTATDRSFLGQVAPYINTTWMSLDRSMRALVQGGQASGFFTGGKVGVLLADVPTSHKLADTVLKPELARIGITNADIRYISNDSGGSQQAQTNSAVLGFSSAGINRILFLHSILVYLGFTNQAQSQGYHPHYAFTDYQLMTGVAAFYGTPEQNKDAIGISTSPGYIPDDATQNSSDVSAPIDRRKVTPGQRRCLDILSKQTGKNYYDPNASGDTLRTWSYYCDEFFAWWEAASHIGNSWTAADNGRGLTTLGSTYLSTLQHSTDWSAGQHDGASSYRVGRYNANCKCFPKISAWLPI